MRPVKTDRLRAVSSVIVVALTRRRHAFDGIRVGLALNSGGCVDFLCDVTWRSWMRLIQGSGRMSREIQLYHAYMGCVAFIFILLLSSILLLVSPKITSIRGGGGGMSCGTGGEGTTSHLPYTFRQLTHLKSRHDAFVSACLQQRDCLVYSRLT